jgi:hypothetical protein
MLKGSKGRKETIMKKSIFAGLCAAVLVASAPAAFAISLTFNGTGDAVVPASGGVHQVTQVANGYALVCTATSEPTDEEDTARFVDLIEGLGTSIGDKDFVIEVEFTSPTDTTDANAIDDDTTQGELARHYPMRATTLSADVGSGFGILIGMTGFPDDDDADLDLESGTVYQGVTGNLGVGTGGRYYGGNPEGITRYSKAAPILSGTDTFENVAVAETHNPVSPGGGPGAGPNATDLGGLDDSETGTIHFERVGDQVGMIISDGSGPLNLEGFASAIPVGADDNGNGVIDGGEVNAALDGVSMTGISFWILQDRGDETPAKFANDSGATMALRISIDFDGPIVTAITSDNEDPAQGEAMTLTANVGLSNGSVTYQWQLDGVDISGETGSTLSIPSLAFNEHSGDYTVVVTDADGPTTSPPFTVLIVTAAKDAKFFE